MRLKAVSGTILTLLMASVVMVLASSIPVIAQSNSTTTVYLNPPTINGTVIGEEFTVNLSISDALEIHDWQAGLTFNSTLLNCTGFSQGEFLSDVGSTLWTEGTINNTAGEITPYSCNIFGKVSASGDGRLAYATFKVKALGVSDIHFRDAKVLKLDPTGALLPVPFNIIDVYTVVVDTTPHNVVTVSDSTGATGTYHSGFYDHAFSEPDKEISFKVTGPNPGFSNVTIPKTLLWVDALADWTVLIDDILVSGTFTESATHTSIYFTYTKGIHKIQIFGTHAAPPSYTLTIYSSPTGVTFTVDGLSRTTPWSGTYSQGTSVILVMPETHDGYAWSHWLEDGDPNRTKTVTVDTDSTLTAVYTRPTPVGGKATPINIPMNKPETPTLWIWLSTIILPLIATAVFVKHKKKKQ